MADLIRHRGPDDEGYVFINPASGQSVAMAGDDTAEGVFRSELKYAPQQLIQGYLEFSSAHHLGMAARRLSILDLSSAGHQPMCSSDGSLWIVYNGEVYNYREIREELRSKGYHFISNTDTEVVLYAYQEWGSRCLHKFNGMWAFAVWDTRRQNLFCACDRFGIKPFYYFYDGKVFVFASEIKAILGSGVVDQVPNDELIYDYLVYGWVDHREETFFQGVKRLRGGCWLNLSARTGALTVQRYYDVLQKRSFLELGSDEEYAQRFYRLFEDSVRLRLISDVPVGICLSGGLDSSSIACIVSRIKYEQYGAATGEEQILKVFTARFEGYDESRFARQVATQIAAEAHWISPTAKGFVQELDSLIWHQEEPFEFIGAYAQWCVFKLIHQAGIKVTLDGQGGDELLAGYYRDYISALLLDLLSEFRVREFLEELVFFNLSYNPVAYGVPKNRLLYLGSRSLHWAYRWAVRYTQSRFNSEDRAIAWLQPEFVARVDPRDSFECQKFLARFERQAYERFAWIGLPALLRLADKSSMAHSVESRTPFLDYRLVEFLFSIPRVQKMRKGVTKYVLREAMKGIIPETVRNRRDKMGFYPYLDNWLRTELKPLIKEVLTSRTLKNRPYLNPGQVLQKVELYLKGNANIGKHVWRWINLELWMRQFIDGA